MFTIIILFNLINSSLSYYIVRMSESQQYQQFNLQLQPVTYYEFNAYFASGIWTRYAPFDGISQVGNIGIFDSNCFNIHNAIDSQSSLINFLYYDCIDTSTQLITKTIKFLTEEGEQVNFQILIDNDQYEFQWYYFQFTQWPAQNRLDLIIVKVSQIVFHDILDLTFPYQSKSLILTFGGGLLVNGNQLLDTNNQLKFSYFPGKMWLYPLDQDEMSIDIYLLYYITDGMAYHYGCQCIPEFFFPISRTFTDQDIVVLTSWNRYCDQLTLNGWVKIFNIKSMNEHATYQFIKMCPNSQNSQITNQNLCLFQLFYVISQNTNKILITTYSYQLPSVNQDFSQNQQLIQKEYEMVDITQWHFIQVVLLENIFTVSINYFENQDQKTILFQQKVNQFHLVQFQLSFGNVLQLQQTLLSIQVYNIQYISCLGSLTNNICHSSCGTCDGPTESDCLTCDVNSKKMYLEKYKSCVCPYGYFDDQQCKTYSDYNFKINDNIFEKPKNCEFGYFEIDDGDCLKCPSIKSTKLLTCQECIQNPKNWYKYPLCSNYLILDEQTATDQLVVLTDEFIFVFDGEDLNLCEFCVSGDQALRNYENSRTRLQQFKQLCQLSGTEFSSFFSNKNCYNCYSISNCVKCQITTHGLYCQQCDDFTILKNGKCEYKFSFSIGQVNTCQSPYYINSKKGCSLCSIENCIYCFEYLKDDLTFSTLYADFTPFDYTESVQIGCALCNDNHIYDFTKGQCIWSFPTIPNCFRSFINLEGQEVCTLADDFTIAPQIINCYSYIPNCQQCIFTPNYSLQCIICDDGYVGSTSYGQCYSCPISNAKICMEGDRFKMDGWVQLIQGFMMQFLPNNYFYPQTANQMNLAVLAISCFAGYIVTVDGDCIQDCNSACQKCVQKVSYYSNNFESSCLECGLNYFKEPNRSQVNGACLSCPQLCELCLPRTENEIHAVNPLFILTEQNRIFTYKCLKPINFKNIKFDPYIQYARYCFDESCSSILELNVDATCSNIEYLIHQYDETYYENRINSYYCNSMGIEEIIIKFNFLIITDGSFCAISEKITITNSLRQKILTLNRIHINITGNNQPDNTFLSSLIIENFHDIYFQDLKFFCPQDFSLIVNNQIDEAINLSFKKVLFYNYQGEQYFSISSPSILIKLFNAQEVSFYDLIIKDSTLFKLRSISTQFNTLFFYNCTFINTVIFNITNSSNFLINQTSFFNCNFFNSTIFSFQRNKDSQLEYTLEYFYIFNNTFKNSTIFTNIEQQQFNCPNIIIQTISVKVNSFFGSQLIVTNKNLSIFYFAFENNTLTNSILFQPDSQIKDALSYVFANWKILENIFINSMLIYRNLKAEISFYLNSFHLQDTQSPINQNSYLFQIQSINLTAENFSIEESYNIKIFYLYQTGIAYFSEIMIKNSNQFINVQQQLECYPNIDYTVKFLHVAGFSNIKLINFELSGLFSFDQSFIQIQSDILFNPNMKENVEFKNISISNSVILKQSLGNLLSLIAIFSEKIQDISFYNLTFTQNTFHQYIDDPSQTSAGLIYIGTQLSQISIDLLFSDSNHLTNSTHSFFVFQSQKIQIYNFLIQNHNYKNDKNWIKVYNINSDNSLSQDEIYFLIKSIFTIQNVGGAFSITTASFILKDGLFSQILAENSAALDIKTQGIGEVALKNLSFSDITVDLSQFVELSSCINIYSKNSLLNLKIDNVAFLFVFNNLGSAILSIVPSQKKNVIIIQNIKLENCISLINTLTKIEFQENKQFSNLVQIRNVSVNTTMQGQLNFFESLGVFVIEDVSKIKNDNALINLKGCELYVSSLVVEGVFLASILKFQDIIKLSVGQITIYSIQQFFPFNIFQITQTTKTIYQLIVMNLKIQKTNLLSVTNLQNNVGLVKLLDIISEEDCNINYKIVSVTPQNNSFINFVQTLNTQTNTHLALINIYSNLAQIDILFYKVILQQNNCLNSLLNGLYFEFANDFNLKINEFQCFLNKFFFNGCLIFQGSQTEIMNSNIIVKNSDFYYNVGGDGAGIFSQNLNFILNNCKFIKNNSTNNGGAIYFDGKNELIKIKSTIITNNSANQGGGVFINSNQHFTKQNFINSFLFFNQASTFANNLNEQPRFLQLQINNLQMKSIQIEKNSTFVQQLEQLPYKVLQQGNIFQTTSILFPSGQTISNFQIFNTKKQKFLNYITEISLSLRNSFGEEVIATSNNTCSLQQNIYEDKQLQNTINLDSVYHNSKTGRIHLDNFTITFDPYSLKTEISQLQISCPTDGNTHQLIYYINFRSFLCQLGEFYIDEGCEICQSSQGFYSVLYNVTKCSIFDKTKFKSITSNRIELLPGFWRPDLLSDYAELCFKSEQFCLGGWEIGDQLCLSGHIGGLCEECDIYNTQGHGYFFRNTQNLGCVFCYENQASVFPTFLTTLWSLFSIALTLRSVEKSNQVYKSLRLRQKYSKILFKLNQDHESILLKMLINYLWIFSIIFTFDINFQISLHIADQTATPIEVMSNNLDCYISRISSIPIIYVKIIFMITLIVSELLFVALICKFYSIALRKKIDKSIISTTAIYLFVSNHASLIKTFCSLLSKRTISGIDYIQGNVSYLFNTDIHNKWMLGFILPGLGICGLLIPIGLFLIIFIQRKKLDVINRRKYICYLFNEYNSNSYFWEQIKIWSKTVMIVILTYFETDVLPKVLFLGISLLLYQILAAKYKPYNIQSLNKIDVISGQICTFAIFLAGITYSFQQQNQKYAYVIQIVILLLFIRLCLPFLYDIFRVYYKKYRILFLSLLVDVLKRLRISSTASYILVRKLSQLKERQLLLQNNIQKLRHYLISMSKLQIEQQRILNSQFSPVTTQRNKLESRETETKKLI